MSVVPIDEVAPAAVVFVDRDAALEGLYADHWRSLFTTAVWLLGDRRLAEETVQDAFVRLAESWDHLRDPAAAPFWLRRTVVNLSRSSIRRAIVGRRIHRTLRPTPDMPEPSGDPAVAEAVRELPRRQRECVVLRFYVDLSVDDIAETLEISAGSVKTHLHRGMQRLAEELGENYR